ncbi:MAG: hypothetical protein Q8N44_09535 [Rubrivivax sp.]|nr:hypothetical protein [Rubrivivax sp.]MDP3083916.1 hypothetical protein [Rubrivivax sp.]
MNALSTDERQALQLVEIIDLKWLLAGEGHRVHVERLQTEPDYARECLALAAASASEAVRAAALRLQARLDTSPI